MKIPGKIILETVVGSTLHGTAVDDGLEDLDLMAIAIESPELFIGFSPVDTWTERTKPEGVRSEAGDVDRVVYGLRKFLGLALKGNPTVILALFAPEQFIKSMTLEGRELQSFASKIISRQIFNPFRGYMRQQHERLLGLRGQRNVTRPELVERHGYDTKYAGHIVRLAYQGVELLETGRLTLPMRDAERRRVIDVRNGLYTLAEVSALIVAAEEAIAKANETSTLRIWPDKRAVQDWMRNTYLAAWSEDEAKYVVGQS